MATLRDEYDEVSEECDIIHDTSTFGVHNPSSGHSFSSTYCLLPALCCMCSGAVYPFSHVGVCLRCQAVVHRGCASQCSKLCPWKFRSQTPEQSELRFWKNLWYRCIDRPAWKQAFEYVDLTKSPHSLYETLSTLFQRSVDQQKRPLHRPVHLFLAKVALTLEVRIRDPVVDPAEIIRTVRCCCDAVCDAVWEVIPPAGRKRKDLFAHICEAADACVLSMADQRIYATVMKAFELQSPKYSVTFTSECSGQFLRRLRSFGPETTECIFDSIPYFIKCSMEIAAHRKVRALVQALEILASGDVGADELLRRVNVCICSDECSQVHWERELRFMEDFMGRKEEWLIGGEGYALTTLYIAVKSRS